MAESPAGLDDYDTRTRTYVGFVRLIKWAVIVIAVVLLLMAYFLT
jgi:hypothetical protein